MKFTSRTPSGKVIDLTCPHRGCQVNQTDENYFECPCHGARFDIEGRAVMGPTTKDLTVLKDFEGVVDFDNYRRLEDPSVDFDKSYLA